MHLLPRFLHLFGERGILALYLRDRLPVFIIVFGFGQRGVSGPQQGVDRCEGRRIALVFQVADRHAGDGNARFHQRVNAVAQALLLGIEHPGVLKVLPIVVNGRVEQPSRDNLQQTEYGEGKDNTGNHVQIFQHGGHP